MNTDLIENRDTTPVANVLNAMGGWPVLDDNWSVPNWQWVDDIASSRANGYSVNYLLSFAVSTDNRVSTKRVIRVSCF
jgi:hypothetical protein